MSHSPIRFREKSDYLPRQCYYISAGGTSSALNNGWRHYEWMADQINPVRGSARKRAPGRCQHLNVDAIYTNNSVSLYGGGLTVVGFVDSEGDDSITPTGSWHPNDPGWSNLLGEFMSTPTYQNLLLEAFNKQKDQVPAKISLINFLVELKDFKPLINSFKKIPKALSDSQSQALSSFKRGNIRRLPKRVAKSGIDTFLSYNFQWAPFIGDLKTLTEIGDSSSKRLDYLRKTKGKEVTVHFQKEDCYQHPQVNTVVWSTGKQWGRTFVKLKEYSCTFNSTWRLLHNLKELDDAFSGLRATYASLGLNNPIKAAWNSIPFSFMLDWVGPLGSWLDNAAVQPFTGQWDIYDCTSSVKEEGTFDWYAHDDGLDTDVVVQTVRVRKYTRLDGLPFTLGAVDFSQLNDTQQKLALSIALSKVLK